MPPFLSPFADIPDASLDVKNYPSIFLVDMNWADVTGYTVQVGSFVKPAGGAPMGHSEQTRLVIQSMAQGLPHSQIILVSAERIVAHNKNGVLPKKNLAFALTVISRSLQPGDLVVVNMGFHSGNTSFACDLLIADKFWGLTDKLGGIVVISAGNLTEMLPQTQPLASHTVVVGGVSADSLPQSRFGPEVTCYGVVPYDLPGKTIPFGQSSAATAYIGGLVMLLLNYAKSRGHILTGKEVVDLLKTSGQAFNVVDNNGTTAPGILPTWALLRQAIDKL